MDPFLAALLFTIAVVWALRRGTTALGNGFRRWGSSVRTAATGHRVAGGFYRGARAAGRNSYMIGAGVGTGLAAGWREGKDRFHQWKADRQETAAAQQAWDERHRPQPEQEAARARTVAVTPDPEVAAAPAPAPTVAPTGGAQLTDRPQAGMRGDTMQINTDVNDIDGANNAGRQLATEATAEREAADAERRDAAAQLEVAQAATQEARDQQANAEASHARATAWITRLEHFAASLDRMGMERTGSHPTAALDAAKVAQTAAAEQREAADQELQAAQTMAAAAERRAAAAAKVQAAFEVLEGHIADTNRGIASHVAVDESARAAEGGAAHRETYGGGGGQGEPVSIHARRR